MTTVAERIRWKTRLLAGVLVFAAAAPVRAQDSQSPPALATAQFGPLTLQPGFEIRELGVDTNVFRESENPKEDFVGTFTPSLDIRLGMGWAQVTGRAAIDLVYFQKYEEERTIDRLIAGRFDLETARIRPYVSGSTARTSSRVNTEINVRAGRRLVTGGSGVALLLGGRSSLTLGYRYEKTAFDQDDVYEGVNLSEVLDQTVGAVDANLQFDLTPLTSLSFIGTIQRDRFVYAPQRDSDTLRVGTTVRFRPMALIDGSATVAYRRFSPNDPTLEEFSGVVLEAALGYTLLNSTRFDVRADRDVHYSFEPTSPYYLTNGLRFTVTQRVAGPVDAQGLAGRESLSYRQFGSTETERRKDTVTTWGAGVGWRLGGTLRLSFNYEFARRASRDPGRTFDGTRIYTSLKYGL